MNGGSTFIGLNDIFVNYKFFCLFSFTMTNIRLLENQLIVISFVLQKGQLGSDERDSAMN